MLNLKRVENKSQYNKDHILIVADCTHLPTTKHIQTFTLWFRQVFFLRKTVLKSGKYYKKKSVEKATDNKFQSIHMCCKEGLFWQ